MVRTVDLRICRIFRIRRHLPIGDFFMGVLLSEITKILIDKVKHSKVIWIFVIGYLIIAFREKMPSEYKLVVPNIERTFERIYTDSLSTLFILLMITSVIALMKYSDKKSKEDNEERKLKYKTYESKSQRPFQINVFENSKILLLQEKPYREISFINNSGSDLEEAQGQVDFYLHRKRQFSVYFDIRNLKEGYGHFVEKQVITNYGYDWDEFDFYIENAHYGNQIVTTARYSGISFTLIPPDITRLTRKWFEIFIPYDLYWLKQILRWQVIPWIKSNFKRQTVFERIPTYLTRKNRRKHLIRIIISTLLIILVSVTILVLIYQFCRMLYDAAAIWLRYLWNLF